MVNVNLFLSFQSYEPQEGHFMQSYIPEVFLLVATWTMLYALQSESWLP